MNENYRKIEVNSPEESDVSYIPPNQSADTLFHFVDKKEFLFSVIENFAIIPRYCVEHVEYLEIGKKKIAYPMLCFCDINLHKMQKHISDYGSYGIAFSKEWGISMGVQPVQYINPKSLLRKDFSEAFLSAMETETDDSAQNYLLSQMYYLKAINGSMEKSGKKILKNFTDECEWRYIPDVRAMDMPQVVDESDIFNVDTLNQALAIDNTCWLKFDLDDIKYIILESREDFECLVEIIGKKELEFSESSKIVSKILIWDDSKGDF